MNKIKRKFYTIDDLYEFCKKNKFERFNSSEMGAPLVVQTFGTFEAVDNVSEGLMPVKLKSCHTGKNLNQSKITDEVMTECKSTFCGRPILGAIYMADTGEYEFRGHDMEINEDGEINYIEQPIGVISQTEEPHLEYDAAADKNYLIASGTIFSEYSQAADILQRRESCACSVELAIEDLSFDCKEDCLSIDKFRFMGVTLLGYEQDGVTAINPGMEGSNVTIADFSKEANSMFTINNQDKLVEVLDKLNTTLSSFNKNSMKGGDKMGKFEELLEKYGKTIEDITFEYEGLADEELEARFAEMFDGEDAGADGGEDATEGAEVETAEEEVVTEEEPVVEEVEPVVEEESEEDEDDESEDEEGSDDEKGKKKKFELKYELSHSDIRCALYDLLSVTSEDGYCYSWIMDIYDSYFVYENYEDSAKYYRQKFTRDGDNIAFDGDRVEIFSEWLTQEEKDALAALKANYEELKAFKEQHEAAETKAAKDAIFESPEYAEIKDTDDFKALMNEADNYSVDEVRVEADLIFAASMKKKFNFAAVEEKKVNSVGINFSAKPDPKKEAYAGLFADEGK